jgi:hypothetical protein
VTDHLYPRHFKPTVHIRHRRFHGDLDLSLVCACLSEVYPDEPPVCPNNATAEDGLCDPCRALGHSRSAFAKGETK